MKKRTLGLIIAGVAAASMIGTGFAAWVITGNASAEEQGNFYVDTVTDKSITLEAEWKGAEDGSISFVGPESQTTTKWLAYEKSDGITEFADLDETLTLKFGLGNDVAPADYNVTFAFTATGNYENAVTNNYIVNPTINGNPLTDGSYTCTLAGLNVSTSQLTADVVVEFAWGTAFNGMNPYTFYNGFDYNAQVKKNAAGTPEISTAADKVAIQTVAKDDLTALNTALNGVTYTLTITVTKVTA